MNQGKDTTFPGLTERHLTDAITWNYYKHWGQGCLAGEGIRQVNGDRSGCLHQEGHLTYTNVPIVAQARLYKSEKGEISAVYSYPNGIGVCDTYFWEIWPVEGTFPDCEDPERFATEAEMEERIAALLD